MKDRANWFIWRWDNAKQHQMARGGEMGELAHCHGRHVTQRSCPAFDSDGVGLDGGRGKNTQASESQTEKFPGW